MMYTKLIVISFAVFLFNGGNADDLSVQVNQGSLQGQYWTSHRGRNFLGFTGIPYANPPIGKLRFKPPVPIKNWNGILNATTFHNPCTQPDSTNGFVGSEDCLYLNVYRPLHSGSKNGNLLPVMFYIHGGTFLLGSASPGWLGPEILLDKDIILVTSNYRLGSFGFISTGDNVVSGNNGLKDLSLALKWTKENAIHFGGDPDNVVVFGNSAGAAAVQLLMLSPLSKNLISKAIIQSGSAFSSFPLAPLEEVKNNTYKLGEYFNCPKTSSIDLVDCLREIEPGKIVKAESEMSWERTQTVVPFYTVIEQYSEGAFLIKHPGEIIKSGEAADIPIIIGLVAQEGAYKASDLVSNPISLLMLDRYSDIIIPLSFHINTNAVGTSREIRKYYFGNDPIDDSKRIEITNMYSEGWFVYPIEKSVQLHAQYSNRAVYFYLFEYRGSISMCDLYGDFTFDYGVCHTDELLYLFTRKRTFPNYIPTTNDERMMDVMTALWTNFAVSGNPNTGTELQLPVLWNPVITENGEYFHIRNYSDVSMSERLHESGVLFWKYLMGNAYNVN